MSSSFVIIILIILEFTKLSLHTISICICTLTAFPLTSGLNTILTTCLHSVLHVLKQRFHPTKSHMNTVVCDKNEKKNMFF